MSIVIFPNIWNAFAQRWNFKMKIVTQFLKNLLIHVKFYSYEQRGCGGNKPNIGHYLIEYSCRYIGTYLITDWIKKKSATLPTKNFTYDYLRDTVSIVLDV